MSVVTSMEQNIKALLKDFDSKKKVNFFGAKCEPLGWPKMIPWMHDLCVQILQANPLMETERKLFVYFFTNPGKLRQVVSELAHRIDTLATANTVATSWTHLLIPLQVNCGVYKLKLYIILSQKNN